MTRPYTMPFGKYKGAPLAEIPDDYLRFLGGLDLSEPLKSHHAAEVRRRSGEPEPAPPPPEPAPFGDYLAPDLRDSARLILDFGEAEFMRRHARDAAKVAVGQRAARALMAFVAPGGGR